jgi:predicted branched-subunit amino acid permease
MEPDTIPAAVGAAAPAPARAPAPAPAPSAVRLGVLTMLPMVAAFVPFALVIGSAAAEQGAPVAGWMGSWLIYGGSAHLAAMRTLRDAGPVAAIATGLLVNARLLVYSTSLARRWPDQPRWFRVVAAALIIDPTWVVAERHADVEPDPRARRRHFLAAGITLGLGWSAAIAVGVLLGARLDGLDLDVFVPLCLLALVGTGLRSPGTQAVVAVAVPVALLTTGWPAGTGLLAAVGAGGAAGVAHDRWRAS